MKNLFLSILVATAAVACNSPYNAVSDAADANAPAGACSECPSSCSDAKKAECSAVKKECSGETCPVTGAKIEG
jgi:hypothetical protein